MLDIYLVIGKQYYFFLEASQIKARNFEIPYFGGFKLADYVPTLENYFDIGKDVVCYNDVDEAELLIRYYLENEEEREIIKNSAHQISMDILIDYKVYWSK